MLEYVDTYTIVIVVRKSDIPVKARLERNRDTRVTLPEK